MSTIPEMDLEKLFLPAWAQESASANRYAHHSGGGEERPDRKRDFQPGRRPQRREQNENRGPRARERQRSRGPAQRGAARDDDRSRRDRFEAPPPLPEVAAALLPDDTGVESLARQIKNTGRAYPLFGIAQVVLQKPERYSVRFTVKKNAGGQAVQLLFVCALDETLWLSEDEVVSHVLRNHFATFYQAERTATEPPKGTYTFVAQCGMSGAILGPPNHHDYQNQLRKLHSERFAKMPFDAFKSRVKIVRDEAVVKKWVEEQSWQTQYVCLNVPEPLKLPKMEEVEKHFRSVHKDAIVKPVQEHTLSGVAARGMRCHGLARLARQIVEDQRHFPLQIATTLSQRFGSLGLQFFKVNRTFTHVCVARPNFLDLETTPVSDGIRRIVQFISSKPKCSRRQLVESLAPTPKPAVIEIQPEAAQTGSSEQPKDRTRSEEPTAEQTAVISDLHWLIHQGHVIEFADGRLDTAKKPAVKPPKPETKPAETATGNSASEMTPAESGTEEQPSQVVVNEPAAPGDGAAPADKGFSQSAAQSNATETADTPMLPVPADVPPVEVTHSPEQDSTRESPVSEQAETLPSGPKAEV